MDSTSSTGECPISSRQRLPRNLCTAVADELAAVGGSRRGDDLQDTCHTFLRLKCSLLPAHIYTWNDTDVSDVEGNVRIALACLDPPRADREHGEIRALDLLLSSLKAKTVQDERRFNDDSGACSGRKHTIMFSAVLLVEYEAPPTRCSSFSSVLTVAMLPEVLVMCTSFFAWPFSRNGRATCETIAGPTAFVRRSSSSFSGSMVNAVSHAN